MLPVVLTVGQGLRPQDILACPEEVLGIVNVDSRDATPTNHVGWNPIEEIFGVCTSWDSRSRWVSVKDADDSTEQGWPST